MQGPRAFSLAVFGGGKGARVLHAHRALGHGHDAEIGSVPAAAPDGFGNFLHVVGNFRNQNHVRAAGDARAQRQPARAMPHDFGDDDAMMAVRRAVQPVNRLGGNVQRGGEAKGRIRHRHVVVNGLGQGDDVEPGFGEMQRVFLRAAAAEADQRVEAVFLVILDDDLGHVARAAVNHHAVRLVAAGAEDGAADGEDAGERALVELQPPVFDEAAKAVAKADDFHAVKAERGFADAADGGVQAGAVAARGQDADAFGFGHCLRHI